MTRIRCCACIIRVGDVLLSIGIADTGQSIERIIRIGRGDASSICLSDDIACIIMGVGCSASVCTDFFEQIAQIIIDIFCHCTIGSCHFDQLVCHIVVITCAIGQCINGVG